MYKPVPTRVDYVQLEHDVQSFWDEHDVLQKYLRRNQDKADRWSFIDGPITANNPMGVHHAWGRSYKDLYNRFWTMRGKKLRYQNGFDCQGLWIEVEVEKEMGFKSKHDIETFGVAEFVEACKARVQRFASIMTQQSLRLGYWMDWENSYFTNSDENNYTIWAFLKKCFEKGWLYKGHDTMPWCPRCGTGISQHEIVTEGYQEITHKSVYLKLPLTGRRADEQTSREDGGQVESAGGSGAMGGRSSSDQSESLLVWTTTPWTLAANVAAAVHPELVYEEVRQGDDVFYVSKGARETAVRGEHEVVGEVQGKDLVGLTYRGPFDELPAQAGVVHRVIAWEDVSDEEGTGIVHIAPGAGAEDFVLSKQYGLDVIAPLEEDGTYSTGKGPSTELRTGFGFLEGRFAGDVAEDVFESLREKGLLYRVQDYTHRYPTCWRCGSELVFRLVDEWFISMDGPVEGSTSVLAPSDGVRGVPGSDAETLRDKIAETSDKVTWIPEFGKARERDWLKNMHDWMISKKRYYGLALPIYECAACGKFEVIGSETELQARAIEGWDAFEGHSPHRPWVDAVKIACSACGAPVERIKDVGNPWLDAGIVPFSTLNYRHDPEYWKQWFPADWVSESFPGQFRNWFYALLAMGTVMVLDTEYEDTPPFLSLFGYALLRDEHGEEMHKSKGNAIEFIDAAERMGADVMRWMYLRANPASNLNFGWHGADELKRGFLSTLWNTYSFFVTYASIDGWTPADGQTGKQANGQARTNVGTNLQVRPNGGTSAAGRSELDRWALSELNQLVETCTHALENYDSMTATRAIEEFVEGLSNWYVRRSRRRFWRPVLSPVEGSEADDDKRAAYETLYTCLATVTRLMAPMTPFLAEDIYRNLVASVDASAPESVHLCDWPAVDTSLIDRDLSDSVALIQRLASLGRAARAQKNLKVRQPLQTVFVRTTGGSADQDRVMKLADQLVEELNVREVQWMADEREFFDYDVTPNLPSLGPKLGQGIRQVQEHLRAASVADKALLASYVRDGKEASVGGFQLRPEELRVMSVPKPGYAVAEEAGYAVAVTTEVTPELADEGMARELVRRIQELRKSAGFDIADRIRLYIDVDGDADVARVLDAWRDYIARETLATEVTAGPGPAQAYAEEQDVEGRKVRLAVEKV